MGVDSRYHLLAPGLTPGWWEREYICGGDLERIAVDVHPAHVSGKAIFCCQKDVFAGEVEWFEFEFFESEATQLS
jgi:hypothetical protein